MDYVVLFIINCKSVILIYFCKPMEPLHMASMDLKKHSKALPCIKFEKEFYLMNFPYS